MTCAAMVEVRMNVGSKKGWKEKEILNVHRKERVVEDSRIDQRQFDGCRLVVNYVTKMSVKRVPEDVMQLSLILAAAPVPQTCLGKRHISWARYLNSQAQMASLLPSILRLPPFPGLIRFLRPPQLLLHREAFIFEQ